MIASIRNLILATTVLTLAQEGVSSAGLPGFSAPKLPTKAGVELSDRAKSIIWNVMHYAYMNDCRPDEPLPKVLDDRAVATCEYDLEQEEKNLNVLTPAERAHPEGAAALARHKENQAHAEKVRALYADQSKAENAADDARKAYAEEAKKNADALWFLKGLESGKFPANVILEKSIQQVRELSGFAERCASSYASLQGIFRDEFLEKPSYTCPLAQKRESLLKTGMPKLFAAMRAESVQKSKDYLEKLASGGELFTTTIACAKDPKACGSTEAQIASVASILGIPAGEGPAANGDFDAALKKGVSVRRIGAYHDARIEKLAAAALKKSKVAFVATAVFESGDEILKNELDIPTFRRREVGFLVKAKGETFCRAYKLVTSASYKGGGRYEPMSVLEVPDIDDTGFAVSSCK